MDIKKLFTSKKVLRDEISSLKKELEMKANFDPEGFLLGFLNNRTKYFDISNGGSYSDHYTIYRGIDLLASLGSGLPVNIYRGDNIIPKDSTLPGGFNIYEPNPNMSLNELNYIALVYFFYKGEYMIEIVDDPFLYLQPINPDRMTRHQNKQDWIYRNGTERRVILNDNLIYLKLLNPDDDKRGLSPIDVVKADIMNEKSAIEYNTAWFRNFGAIAGFFYDTENKAKPKDMDLVVKQYKDLKTGVDKAGDTLGLPFGIRYEQFSQTMAEMQYLESRKDIRDRILAVFGDT